MEDQQRIGLVLELEVHRRLKVDAEDVFVPVGQLPDIAVAGAVDHALVADLRVGIDPDDHELGLLFGQLFAQGGNVGVVADLLRKGGVDQHDIVVQQRFHRQVQDDLIFKVADILFKKDAAAVIRLVSHRKDLLGQRDQRVLVQIHDMLERPRQLAGDERFAAGGRACYQNQLFQTGHPFSASAAARAAPALSPTAAHSPARPGIPSSVKILTAFVQIIQQIRPFGNG